MPGDERLLDEFLKSLQRDRLEGLIRRVLDVPETQQVRAIERMAEALCGLVRTVWNEMKLAGEAGSLLKIEDALREAIETGKEEWEEKLPLFRITEFGLDGQAEKTQYLRSIPGQDADFWSRAEPIVLAALQAYAERAENGGGFQRRLFASDAARGFAFIDVCRQRYDVVLMNPPFGEPSLQTKAFAATEYPETKSDIDAAFVEMASDRALPHGLLGEIDNRTQYFKGYLSAWRERHLLVKRQIATSQLA